MHQILKIEDLKWILMQIFVKSVFCTFRQVLSRICIVTVLGMWILPWLFEIWEICLDGPADSFGMDPDSVCNFGWILIPFGRIPFSSPPESNSLAASLSPQPESDLKSEI